ncbi:MAG: hypothetical protein ACE5HI_05020 [bacterium]
MMAKLKKREKIMVELAGLVLILFVFNQFVCGKPKQQQQRVTKKAAVEETTADTLTVKVEKKPKPLLKREARKPLEFPFWGRDPFAETFRLAELDPTHGDSTDFVLRGVIWKGSEAHVLIGDEILKEGEQRGDLKVLAIEKDRVVCKKRGKIVTLMLDDNEVL